MGVYTRYKRDSSGLRKLVELLESTPVDRRQKMIEVGNQEDPDYTKLAVDLMLSFDDIIKIPDMELSELLSSVPPRIVALAIQNADVSVKERFLKNALPAVRVQLKEMGETQGSLREIGGARLKLITTAREQERKGLLSVKKIPGN